MFFHSYAKLPKGTFMGHGSSQGQSPDQRQPEVAPTSVPGGCGAFKGGFFGGLGHTAGGRSMIFFRNS